MAFVPGFEHDLFVSYAHNDNVGRAPADPGWVEDLHTVLEQRLAQLLGRKEAFNIWRDPRLRGHEHIDDTIRRRVQNSALFLSVLSPSYLASSYCMEELQLFAEGRHDSSQRILKVKLLPVPEECEPAPLRDVRGYTFYRTDPHTRRAMEFWRTNGLAVDQDWWNEVVNLAYEVEELLRQMKERQAQPAQPAAGRPAVFLAEVAPGLEAERQELRVALKQQGLRVLPEQKLPSGPKLAATVQHCLKECRLAVYLLGDEFGPRAFGDTRSIPQLQYDLARQAGLTRLVWLPPDVEPSRVADDQQRAFLEAIEAEPDSPAPVDLLRRGGLEALKDEVLKKVGPAADAAQASIQRKVGAPQIDIACQPPDREAALHFKEHVYRCRFNVNVAVDDSPTASFGKRYQDILKRSDVVLILYGNASPQWVQQRAEEARAAVLRRGRSRKGPLLAIVYDGPPPDKEPLPFGYHELDLITCRDALDKDAVLRRIRHQLGA